MAAITGTLLVLSGCVSAPPFEPVPQVAVEDKPTPLQPGYQALNREGRRNYVLNLVELGIDAFQLGHDHLASQALDQALDEIELVWSHDPHAEAARKLWYSEGRKRFKGEPYERAMAYYYRGLLYISEGDLENARATFRAGQQQDAFAVEAQNRADFASFFYLEAWTSLMLGDTAAASEPLRWLANLRPDLAPPTPRDNLLIIAETGNAPVKLSGGPDGAGLRYQRGPHSGDVTVHIRLDGTPLADLYPAEDVFWQAGTRGGRPVDYILHDKVVFKKNWESAGTSLTQVGLAGILIGSQVGDAGDRDKTMGISAGVAAVGLIAGAVAGKVKPQADTRRIRNLPNTLHLTAVPATPGTRTIAFSFPGATVTREITVPDQNLPVALAWARPATHIVSGRYYQPSQ